MLSIPGKVAITCALTGGIHGKEANPNLPEQTDEIIEQGIAAWKAGASILHVHARNPDGSNSMDTDTFAYQHKVLCEETDAVVLVVSEERGTVSLVTQGALTPVADTNALREQLQNIFQPAASGKGWNWGRA